jgi:pyruvate formate lyase activating enzyme
MTDLPATPTSTLEKCAAEAVKTGLRFVYIDNSPIITGENTYCYNCNELLVERVAGKLKKINLVDDRCPVCGVWIKFNCEKGSFVVLSNASASVQDS